MFAEQTVYQSLEIGKIISLISKHCRSDLGVLAAANARPASDLSDLLKRHELLIQ